MNTNFKVIALIRLGIKPESTAPEANAFTLGDRSCKNIGGGALSKSSFISTVVAAIATAAERIFGYLGQKLNELQQGWQTFRTEGRI